MGDRCANVLVRTAITSEKNVIGCIRKADNAEIKAKLFRYIVDGEVIVNIVCNSVNIVNKLAFPME